MTAAEGSITSLQGTVSGHTSSINTMQSNLAGLTTRVGDAEGDIDDLETDMTSAQGDITSLDTRVTALEQGGGGGGSIDLRTLSVSQALDILQHSTSIRLDDGTSGSYFNVVSSENAGVIGTVINYDGGHYHYVQFEIAMHWKNSAQISARQKVSLRQSHPNNKFLTLPSLTASMPTTTNTIYAFYLYVTRDSTGGDNMYVYSANNMSISSWTFHLSMSGVVYTEAETYYGTPIT
jgi:hypothetical protein